MENIKVLRITLFITVLLSLITVKTYAQKDTLIKNGVYIQLFGNTETLLSLNYERIFYINKTKLIDLSLRTGFGLHKSGYDSSLHYGFVLELNSIIGRKYVLADVGVGYSPHFNNSDLSSPYIPVDQRSNYYYVYTIRLGARLNLGGIAFIRISQLLTYRPVTPKSGKLFYRKGFGVSMGLLF